MLVWLMHLSIAMELDLYMICETPYNLNNNVKHWNSRTKTSLRNTEYRGRKKLKTVGGGISLSFFAYPSVNTPPVYIVICFCYKTKANNRNSKALIGSTIGLIELQKHRTLLLITE